MLGKIKIHLLFVITVILVGWFLEPILLGQMLAKMSDPVFAILPMLIMSIRVLNLKKLVIWSILLVLPLIGLSIALQTSATGSQIDVGESVVKAISLYILVAIFNAFYLIFKRT